MSATGGPRGPRQPLFLERRSYRRRRLVDAASADGEASGRDDSVMAVG